MIKSGLIFGAAGFVFVLAASAIVSPFCAICVALLLGLGAGYVASVFDKPATSQESLRGGAVAGAIAGGLSIIGQFGAAIVNVLVLQQSEGFMQLFGLDQSGGWLLCGLASWCPRCVSAS